MGGRQVYTCKHILTAFIFQFPGNSTYCGAMLGFLSKMLFNTALPNLAVPNCMDQTSHRGIVTGTSMSQIMGQWTAVLLMHSLIYIVFDFQAMKISAWTDVEAASFICSHLPVRANLIITEVRFQFILFTSSHTSSNRFISSSAGSKQTQHHNQYVL